MPVLVQINGKPDTPFSTNLMPAGRGDFYLYLNGTMRGASQTDVGDQVTVTIRFDEGYRGGPQDPMPPWFGAALKHNPKAEQNWEALTPSRKKEILRYFSWLKSQEAIERNLERVLYVLSGNEGRFMARSWKDGA